MAPDRIEIHLTHNDLTAQVLPAFLMAMIVGRMKPRARPENKAFLDNVETVFVTEMTAWLSHLRRDEADKLVKRVRRVAVRLLDRFHGSEATPLAACHKLLQALLEQGLWWYETDGAFDVAYRSFVGAILNEEDNVAELDAVDRSAAKNARRMLDQLKTGGYYTRPCKTRVLELLRTGDAEVAA